MKNIKISSKLLVSFVVLIILTVVVGALGVFGMRTMSDQLAMSTRKKWCRSLTSSLREMQ